MAKVNTKTGEVVNPDEGGVQLAPDTGLSQSDGAAIDIQVATAKRYPRSIGKFKQQALSMVTLDEATAALCSYSLPRGGKQLTGPSVRMAEIVANAWGNLRIEAKVTGEDEHFVYAESVAWDLETNVAAKRSLRKGITYSEKKGGGRYNADMIATTANALSSIVKRNAIFDVVPKAFVRELEIAAKALIAGDIKTLPVRRQAMLDHFKSLGISNQQVLRGLGKQRIEDIDLDDFVILRGIANSIKDGEVTPENAFVVNGSVQDEDYDPTKSKAENLADRLSPNHIRQPEDSAIKNNTPPLNDTQGPTEPDSPVGGAAPAPSTQPAKSGCPW